MARHTSQKLEEKQINEQEHISHDSEEGLPMWTPNSVIRHRDTGVALLVVHGYRICTIVVDLNDKSPLVAPKALLEREYPNYARDVDMRNEDSVNFGKKWHYKYVKM